MRANWLPTFILLQNKEVNNDENAHFLRNQRNESSNKCFLTWNFPEKITPYNSITSLLMSRCVKCQMCGNFFPGKPNNLFCFIATYISKSIYKKHSIPSDKFANICEWSKVWNFMSHNLFHTVRETSWSGIYIAVKARIIYSKTINSNVYLQPIAINWKSIIMAYNIWL